MLDTKVGDQKSFKFVVWHEFKSQFNRYVRYKNGKWCNGRTRKVRLEIRKIFAIERIKRRFVRSEEILTIIDLLLEYYPRRGYIATGSLIPASCLVLALMRTLSNPSFIVGEIFSINKLINKFQLKNIENIYAGCVERKKRCTRHSRTRRWLDSLNFFKIIYNLPLKFWF